jgi:hypothetical protein
LAGIFNKAYSQVTTIAKGVSGFRATGIYPLNPSVFSEEDFVAMNTLQSNNEENLSSAPTPDIIVNSYLPQQENSVNSRNSNFLISYKQSCSRDTNPSSPVAVSSLPATIEAVSPLPLMGPQKSYRKSKAKQHSEILTGTPMKVSLERKKVKKNSKSQKKSRLTAAISSKERKGKELRARRKRLRNFKMI